ncbi:MAG: hypothetical protein II304_01175 [Bacteroidales bacterium]|nr:hypothetical protein [Bacteroidales bacterium]
MAIVMEDECCGCAVPAYPCLGSACPRRNIPHFYCDECEKEVEELYKTEDGDLCEKCVLMRYEKVRLD